VQDISALLVLLGGHDEVAVAAAAAHMAEKCINDKRPTVALAVSSLAVQVISGSVGSSSSSSIASRCAAKAMAKLAWYPTARPLVAATPGCMEVLLQAMQSTDHQLQYQAIEAARQLVFDKDACKSAVALGYVPVLVQRLGSLYDDVQDAALGALVNINRRFAGVSSFEAAVTGREGVHYLLQQLPDHISSSSGDSSDRGCTAVQLAAADGLLKLAGSAAGKAWIVATEGSAHKLLAAICSDSSQMQMKALAVVKHLASSAEFVAAAAARVQSGFIPVLVQFLITGDDAARVLAAEAIVGMAINDRAAVLQGVGQMMQQLVGNAAIDAANSSSSSSSSGSNNQLAAAQGLKSLAANSAGADIVLATPDWSYKLLQALDCTNPQLQAEVVDVVYLLIKNSTQAVMTAWLLEVVPQLVQVLVTAEQPVQQTAATALAMLGRVYGTQAVVDAGAVERLVCMLEAEVSSNSSSSSSHRGAQDQLQSALRGLDMMVDEPHGKKILLGASTTKAADADPSGRGCSSSTDNSNPILQALLLVLRDADIQMQVRALQTFSKMALEDSSAARLAIQAGFMPVLQQLLGAADDKIQTAAAKAIESLVSTSDGLQFVLASGGVSNLLQQLRTDQLADSVSNSSRSRDNSSSSWLSRIGRLFRSLIIGNRAHRDTGQLQAAKGLSQLAVKGNIFRIGPHRLGAPASEDVGAGAQVILHTPGSIAALLEAVCSVCTTPVYDRDAAYIAANILSVLEALMFVPEFDMVAASAAASWAACVPVLHQNRSHLFISCVRRFWGERRFQSVLKRLQEVIDAAAGAAKA
jgi:hypothetical protein